MKIFYLTILFAYLSLATLPAKGRKVYISPLPRTAVPDGSVQAPFSTIEEALSALSAGKEESAELILLDGDHFLSEGIRLSGNTCPVKELTIKALNLHKAVLRLDKPLAGYLKPVTDDRIRKRVRKEAADRIREIGSTRHPGGNFPRTVQSPGEFPATDLSGRTVTAFPLSQRRISVYEKGSRQLRERKERGYL